MTDFNTARLLTTVLAAANDIILGKERELRWALACLLARGHLLIEDVPGVGKTTLAQLLARLLGLEFSRIQFTSDLLPADILGASVYERSHEQFQFHPGPIFAQLVLADEINRATPKAQSALLEAMEERQVTIEGTTHPLPQPFFVIATQNPSYQVGTFPLPESQLDRFLMRIELGYPSPAQEKILFAGEDRRRLIANLPPALTLTDLITLQQRVEQIHIAPPVIDYCYAIVQFTRTHNRFLHGLSPRAGLGLLRAARAWAMIDGRSYLLPEDVQAIVPVCVPHRLHSGEDDSPAGHAANAAFILDAIPVP
ncbi:MoxR family ATPase [Rhodoferax sp. 4810]|uniref:MoxR family ATPase n=1 Tax=Thiospirillum jenense TaxID=1653858 RepID=A0A839HGR9_9GAMM|nr:MoxR family ATPase [Thiospirillum jenense]MBB1076331.1 MoxR family ATPase [Rhodoferax jenense]MBB1126257.1 MoxR family ATPase [Thiospirillum jenense]